MNASLAALVALQALDSAADAARRRLSELPAAEKAIETKISEATAAVEAVKAQLAENQKARRDLERDVAAVDTRLARFDDHKAAVKTNQEYTALLHEIATGKQEKDGIEERILVQMEAADELGKSLKAADAALARTRQDGETTRASFATERRALEGEIARLTAERKVKAAEADARALALYEQLLKARRGLAVAAASNGVCNACHVRLRPTVDQQVRRNDSIVQCDSCQRILYFQAPPAQQPSTS